MHPAQIGSVLLFGLYVIVKYFGKEWITWLLQWYFTFAGVGSVGKVSTYLSTYRCLPPMPTTKRTSRLSP